MRQRGFDTVVTIEQPVETADSYGQRVVTWQVFAANVPAEVTQRLGKNHVQGEAPYSVEYSEFTIRYNSAITERMRVLHESVYFYLIGAPIEIGRRHYLRLACEAGNHDGLKF